MKRKRWPDDIKFKIVLEGMQGHANIGDLCAKYELHQSQYYVWRDQFLREGAKVFQNKDTTKREEQMKKKKAKMERFIGEQTLELKKND